MALLLYVPVGASKVQVNWAIYFPPLLRAASCRALHRSRMVWERLPFSSVSGLGVGFGDSIDLPSTTARVLSGVSDLARLAIRRISRRAKSAILSAISMGSVIVFRLAAFFAATAWIT